MTNQVNIAFIGVGALTTKQHLPNAFHNPLFNVYALCDIDTHRLETYGQQYAADRVTTDYHELIADANVDVIVIAIQPELQASIAVDCLKGGKDVYVEKPLAHEIDISMDVARVVRDTGRKLAVGFNRRFAPSYRDVFDIVHNDTGPLIMNYRLVDDERDRPAAYQGRPRLLDEACHVFDVFNWLARSEPVRVYAVEPGRKGDNHVIIDYANGVSASLMMSSFGAFHWPKERLEVVGDNKVVAVEDFVELQTGGVPGITHKNYAGREYDGFAKGYGKAYEVVGLPFYRYMRRMMGDLLLDSGLIDQCPDREKWGVVAERYPDQIRVPINYSCDKGWYNALDHFGACVLSDRTPETAGPEDGVKTVVISTAAMQSIETGKPIDLDCNTWRM